MFSYVTVDDISQTTSPDYKPKAVLSLAHNDHDPSYEYRIGWYCEVNNDSVSGKTEVLVQFNGEHISNPTVRSEANDWLPLTGFLYVKNVWPDELVLSFRRSGPGTSKIRNARLEVVRVA